MLLTSLQGKGYCRCQNHHLVVCLATGDALEILQVNDTKDVFRRTTVTTKICYKHGITHEKLKVIEPMTVHAPAGCNISLHFIPQQMLRFQSFSLIAIVATFVIPQQKPIATDVNNTTSQSEFEANTRNWRQARENACGQNTIGFGLDSHWLKK